MSKCINCGKRTEGNMYCCHRCQYQWHNRTRTLPINTRYKCEICGKKVEKYAPPSRRTEKDNRFCGRTCAGKWRQGQNHPNWSGGRRLDKDGYVMVWNPTHPEANNSGLVREHRLVMEKVMGRPLLPTEVVHHKDGNRSNNRLTNLRLYASHAEHMRDETANWKRTKKGQFKCFSKKG